MTIKALVVEFGIKNIIQFRKNIQPKNIEIIYGSSFLDIADTIHLKDVHIIFISDFRGITSTVGYIKMFKTTKPNFKVIVLCSHKTYKIDTRIHYIQRGADSVFESTDFDGILTRLKYLSSIFMEPEDISDYWSKCTKSVIRYIKDHYQYAEKLIPEMTKALGYSESMIYHSVKKDTKKCLGDWIRSLRVKGAIELIKSTPYSLKEISKQVGYKSQQGLIKIIKKLTGKNPSDYRDQF